MPRESLFRATFTGAEAAPIYGQIPAGGSAAIFLAEHFAERSIENEASLDISTHYAALQVSEQNSVDTISNNEHDYNQHCGSQ